MMGCRYASRQLRGLRGCSGRLAFVDAYDLPLLARQVSLPRPPQRLLGNQQRDDDAEDRRPYGSGLGVLERGQVDAAQAEAVERVSERRDGALRCRYILRRVVHHPGRVALRAYTGQKETGYRGTLEKKSNHSARCFFGSACRQSEPSAFAPLATIDHLVQKLNLSPCAVHMHLPLGSRPLRIDSCCKLTRAHGSTGLPDRSRLERSTALRPSALGGDVWTGSTSADAVFNRYHLARTLHR